VTKNAKAPAPAKNAKASKAPKVDHAVQKGLLDKHRVVHDQADALDVKVRPKLQYYTLADLKAYLERRSKSKSKLNLWVPDEERKAREKAAAAARSQGNRSNNIATASIADLLGGANPFRKGEGFVDESKQVPEKFRRYYRLLVDMRDALHKGLAFHSEEALKKSGKDDARRPVRLLAASRRRRHRHRGPRFRPLAHLERAGSPQGDRRRDRAHEEGHLWHLRDHRQGHPGRPSDRGAVHPLFARGTEGTRT